MEDFSLLTDLDEVEVIEPMSSNPRTPLSPPTATSRTLTTRNRAAPSSSSLAPSETMTQCSAGTNAAGKVGDVKGLEVIFGYIPPCNCGQVTTPSESHGEELRQVFPEVPSRLSSPVQLFPVDNGTTFSGHHSMEVQGSRIGSRACGRSSAGHCPDDLQTPEHDQAGIQRRGGESDLQDLCQAHLGQAPKGCQGEENDSISRNRGGLRGVPEIPSMEEPAEEDVECKQDLTDKQVRKIRAAVKQAVSFWRQIQAMLTGHGNEETEISKIMRQTNAEICRELYLRPEGTKRSRQIAEAMGLSHHQLKTVAEVFNPGCFSKRALKHQLIPGKAFDLELGSDLRNKDRQKEVIRYLKDVRPGLVTVAPPCKLFSQLQNLSMNRRYRSKELMKKYLEDKQEATALLEFAISVCLLCQELELTFVFEHPFTATSWQIPAMQKLLRNPLFHFSRADQCEYGLRGPRGGLHRKATGFITNCRRISEVLKRRCAGNHEHEVIIGGRVSQLAQKYPVKLIDQILEAYQQSLGEPIETMSLHNVVAENQRWDDFLRECLRDLRPGEEQHSGELQDHGSGQLPPDEHLPHFGVYHHHSEPGSDQVLRDHTDVRHCPDLPGDTECQGGLQEQREEPADLLAVEEVIQSAEGEGKDLPLEGRFTLKRLLQRAHEGLGHPSVERFVRILRYANAKPNVIEEAKKLKCSVCQRHQQVRPTRRSAPLKELEFNDCVGADVIYLPLPNGKTRPSLNLIDWSSKFQLMIPTSSKKPESLREAYRHWLRLLDHQRG